MWRSWDDDRRERSEQPRSTPSATQTPAERVLSLQRTIGNRGVSRLIGGNRMLEDPELEPELDVPGARAMRTDLQPPPQAPVPSGDPELEEEADLFGRRASR